MKASERKQLKDAGFEWDRCERCHRKTWCVETMNIDKPWLTNYQVYQVPEIRCYSCMGHDLAEELLEYC